MNFIHHDVSKFTMKLSPLAWPAPLTEKPTIIGMGSYPHDEKRSYERYHLDFWCFHMFPYPIEVRFDGTIVPLPAGSANVVPPGMVQEYDFRTAGSHLYVHFRCSGPAEHLLPAALSLEGDFDRIWRE